MEEVEPILSFDLNGNFYEVYIVDIVDEDKDAFGLTYFQKSRIEIKSGLSFNQKLRTLKHELTHCWLYEYGHTGQTEDEAKTFTQEDVCEIVACSNDWINEIVEKFKETMEDED